MIPQVTPVATEQFVTANARQDHGHVAAGKLRYEIGRDKRCIRHRLVHVPQQARQERDDVRPYHDLLVLCVE